MSHRSKGPNETRPVEARRRQRLQSQATPGPISSVFHHHTDTRAPAEAQVFGGQRDLLLLSHGHSSTCPLRQLWAWLPPGTLSWGGGGMCRPSELRLSCLAVALGPGSPPGQPGTGAELGHTEASPVVSSPAPRVPGCR